MPRSCTICSHPKRHEIETIAAQGQAIRAIALNWRISRDALQRHVASGHVLERIEAKVEERRQRFAEDLWDEIDKVGRAGLEGLSFALQGRDASAVARNVAALTKLIDLTGRLRGQLRPADPGPREYRIVFEQGVPRSIPVIETKALPAATDEEEGGEP
jgi:hypothetical protein